MKVHDTAENIKWLETYLVDHYCVNGDYKEINEG